MKIHTHVIPVLALLLASCSLWQSPRSGNGQSSALADGQRRTAPRRSLQQADGVAGVPLLAAPIRGEKLIKREGYTVSYNTKYRIANYVAWKLTPERMRGSAKRAQFFEDPELASNEKVYFGDYSGSGFDRGHMCPAGDNKWSPTAMLDCCIMSNICPQNHTLNGGDWRILEEACRAWVSRKKESIYIIAGPIFTDAPPRWMKKRVRIPDGFFKALVCLDAGRERGIAFVYDNVAGSRPMDSYTMTIDEVEQLTGFDLFHSLPAKQQKELEAQRNLRDWTH